VFSSPGQARRESVEVLPIVIHTRLFPARPSSVPEIRDFLCRCLRDSPLNDVDDREVSKAIFGALLDAAGPEGMIEVSCRIYPDRVEFDVLRPGAARLTPVAGEPVPRPAATPRQPAPEPAAGSFAEWLTEVLRRKGITREDAAVQLGVSVKTVGRWVGGQTEPRLRDLRRIQEQFGDVRLG